MLPPRRASHAIISLRHAVADITLSAMPLMRAMLIIFITHC